MLRRLVVPTLAAALVLTACDQSPTSVPAAVQNDYALLMFGEAGSSLEGSMGAQHPARPFDGRSGRSLALPTELALTAAQRAEIEALRTAFRTEHATALDAMKAIFEEARAAREGGATREEVRAILITARPIGLALREDVWALHEAIRAVLTAEQLAWIQAHRPRMDRPMMPRP